MNLKPPSFANKKNIAQIGISNLKIGREILKSQKNNAEEKKAKDTKFKKLSCILK